MNVDTHHGNLATRDSPLRMLILEPDEMLRNGLRTALSSERKIEVQGACETVEQAVHMAVRMGTQVVLTELVIGEAGVVELCERLRALGSPAAVAVLSRQSREADVRTVLAAGARAFIDKDDGYQELLEALRGVATGRRYLSDSVECRVLRGYAARVCERHGVGAAQITAREREVLARIGQGQTNKVIARALSLSVKTVEKHRSNLMRKLGLHNTAAVTVYALRHGMIAGESAAQ